MWPGRRCLVKRGNYSGHSLEIVETRNGEKGKANVPDDRGLRMKRDLVEGINTRGSVRNLAMPVK